MNYLTKAISQIMRLATNMPAPLYDTCLAAIVKDELVNPAGGIEDFVHSTVPYVEKAVIVDTGSKDGTRDILSDMQKEYNNLHVFDRPFDGYASSRNFSLEKAMELKKGWALVLDADERLTKEDFGMIRKKHTYEMKEEKMEVFCFCFSHLLPDGEHSISSSFGERLFRPNFCHFYSHSKYGPENLSTRVGRLGSFENLPVIKHFIPTNKAKEQKSFWYSKMREGNGNYHSAPIEISFTDNHRTHIWKYSGFRAREQFPGLRKLSAKELARLKEGVLGVLPNFENIEVSV